MSQAHGINAQARQVLATIPQLEIELLTERPVCLSDHRGAGVETLALNANDEPTL